MKHENPSEKGDMIIDYTMKVVRHNFYLCTIIEIYFQITAILVVELNNKDVGDLHMIMCFGIWVCLHQGAGYKDYPY